MNSAQRVSAGEPAPNLSQVPVLLEGGSAEKRKALEQFVREPPEINLSKPYFFFFALVPLAFLAGFLVPHGLRVPQPFPANLLTSRRGKVG